MMMMMMKQMHACYHDDGLSLHDDYRTILKMLQLLPNLASVEDAAFVRVAIFVFHYYFVVVAAVV